MFILKNFVRKKEDGFSLIELVVVIAVLSVLSSIGIPSFNCFQKKSKAAAALQSIRQIQKECELTKNLQSSELASFSDVNINGYQNAIVNNELASANNQNKINCGTDTISLKPDSNNTNVLPSFSYNNQTNKLSFFFRGITGNMLSRCIDLVCDNNSNNFISNNQQLITENRNNILSNIQQNSTIVMDNSFAERGCSAYVLVSGSTWDQAQANAQALGGNLTTPNNDQENKFLIDQYTTMLESQDSNWGNGIRSGAWIGLSSDAQGNLSFANGESLDAGYESPFGVAQENYPDEYRNSNTRSGYHLLMKDPSGHAQGHGGLDKWWREPVTGGAYYDNDEGKYWGYNFGIAEIPMCNEN